MQRNFSIIFLAFFMLFFMNLGEVFSSTVDAESGEKKVSAPGERMILPPAPPSSLNSIQDWPRPTMGEDELLDSLVRQVNLNIFAAGIGQSSCGNDSICLEGADFVKAYICVNEACEGRDTSKKPAECFPDVSDLYSSEEQGQINTTICRAAVQSPNSRTRKIFLSRVPNTEEGYLVEIGALILASKGDAEACRTYFKEYYQPLSSSKLDYKRYRVLFGCSILAGESTLQEANDDYKKWLQVIRGSEECSAISNNALEKVCEEAGPAADIFPK